VCNSKMKNILRYLHITFINFV